MSANESTVMPSRGLPPSPLIGFALRLAACRSMLLVTLLTGCGTNSGELLVPVEGRVLIDGEPMQSGSVITTPAEGRGARGTIGEDGHFLLTTRDAGKGAVVGVHRVAVVAYDHAEALNKNPEAEVTLIVPARYTSPETSGLTIDVKPNETNNFTLELNSSSP